MSNIGSRQRSDDPLFAESSDAPFVEGEEGEYIRSSTNLVYDTRSSGVNEEDQNDEEDSVNEVEQRQILVSRAFQQGTHYMSIELVLKGMKDIFT
jgi:hypothetical protein